MANTYTQIIIQIIFAVKFRERLIRENHREELQRYITGIIRNQDSKLLEIYCNPDHVHILIGLDPKISISEMARNIKMSSSKWINSNDWYKGTFRWQEGYSAFSYSKSQIKTIANYIKTQPMHHKATSFKEEYLDLLKRSDIEYNDDYLFDWFE